MPQERCVRRCLTDGRVWEVGEVREAKANEDGDIVITDHFRRVGDDEVVVDKEVHSPEAVARAKKESNDLDRGAALVSALDRLDPEDNSHWTARGYPSIAALHLETALELTRSEVSAAYPGFDRDLARDLKSS
jgi:hypothetical protein